MSDLRPDTRMAAQRDRSRGYVGVGAEAPCPTATALYQVKPSC